MPGVLSTARQTGAPPAAVFAAMRGAQLAWVPPLRMQSQKPFGSKLEHVASTGTASQDPLSHTSRSKVASPWSGTATAPVRVQGAIALVRAPPPAGAGRRGIAAGGAQRLQVVGHAAVAVGV